MHESVQERTPEESQNKVAGNVTVTSMKWQLYLTPSTYTLQSPSHLYFSHFCLNFIPQHSFPWTSTHKASFPFKAHFFISHCFLADREICLHHTYENLPTIVSEALSSDKNFFVSWVEFFREIFAEKNILGSVNFSNDLDTQKKCLFLFHIVQVHFLAWVRTGRA